MKVGVVGAGFGGLSAAYWLAKNGADVTIIESEKKPGGLAVGFENKDWDWSLEKHYHHWFTNDYAILELAKEIGHRVIITTPRTSTFVGGKILQLDSAVSLLRFGEIPLVDRFRTGLVLAYLKLTNNWKALEKITAKDFLILFGGKKSWNVLWEPLFCKKFSYYFDQISAAWFWARIKKRTKSLAYPEGGFLRFASRLTQSLEKLGGRVIFDEKVISIERKGNRFFIKTDKNIFDFEKVIVTLPSFHFASITKGLPKDYVHKLLDTRWIGSVNLVLSLNKPLLKDGSYWLNVNSKEFPFLVIVEHTNFIKKKHYGNNHIVYVGAYLPHEHKYFNKDVSGILREFYPFISVVNPSFDKSWINKAFLFKAQYSQPIVTTNYSQKIPSFHTPIEDLYLCNMQQVYPWDRGTNYAVENGKKLADILLKRG
jgi:protoporphyrinogen oxidase